MGMKYAAVVAVMTLGLMSTAGHAAAITFAGQFTGTEALQADYRLLRDGNPSVAGTQKPFPGTVYSSNTFFDIDKIMVMPGSVVSITENANNDRNTFFSVYDTLFNPSDLSENYLGDAGFSGGDITFSITAPTSGDIVLVVNSINDNSVGAIYSATVAYTAMSAVPLPASAPMFGGALLALGAVGYGVKRKKSAAAA